MESTTHATGESSPQNPPTGQAEAAPPPGPEASASFLDRITDAAAWVVYAPLSPSVTLALKVRPVGLAETAQLGVVQQQLMLLVGKARTPDPEDLTGLQAAEMDAARGSAADQARRAAEILQASISIAKRCTTHVRDLDDPTVWRPVIWVDGQDQEGEGKGAVRLHMETRLTPQAVERIAMAAMKPVREVAGAWERFPGR